MSLEQYKNANRKELWEILQIQADCIAGLEKELRNIEHAVRNEDELLKMQKTQNTRDLDQQAIACDWIYKNVSELSNRNSKAIKSRYCQLKIKARALQDNKC
jgi:hypothetical protein